VNVATWLARAALKMPHAPAVARGESVVLTYADLARRATALATGLTDKIGLRPGERVAVVSANHVAYVEALFATWWAGLVAVPINVKLHPAESAWIIEHSGAKVVMASVGVYAGARSDVREGFTFGTGEYEDLMSCEGSELTPRAPDDPAWLFYTSGTTGRPKGAILSHRNLTAMSLAHLVDLDPTNPGDALIHAAPMSHGSGLLCIPHVARGGINIVPESAAFAASEVLALVARWGKASVFAAPTMIRRLVDAAEDFDESALRTIVWGGAPMHVSDVLATLDRFGPRLAQLYGQGETPMTITGLNKMELGDRTHPDWRHRLGSAGYPRSSVDVIVADNERARAPGEIGEVLVRGDTVMGGYWADQVASAAALRGGWLHTGDIGVMDPSGCLTLKDRSKDVIISGGSNIYPREVEDVLATHPDVSEVSVIGRPDQEWGEVAVAYVVGAADRAELDRMCLERIARFKRPKHYVFLDALPRNNYGKVLKTELRTMDARPIRSTCTRREATGQQGGEVECEA
jgi:long-chain acyl-CoA synthetase